jgi:hypothetical protein
MTGVVTRGRCPICHRVRVRDSCSNPHVSTAQHVSTARPVNTRARPPCRGIPRLTLISGCTDSPLAARVWETVTDEYVGVEYVVTTLELRCGPGVGAGHPPYSRRVVCGVNTVRMANRGGNAEVLVPTWGIRTIEGNRRLTTPGCYDSVVTTPG